MNHEPPDLEIKNVFVRPQPTFSAGGAIGQQVVVTFYVGEHGPFRLEYTPQMFTPEKARADMEHQVVQIRRLLTGA